MRALAIMSFGGISRHPEMGTRCRVCEAGEPSYCAGCLVDQVVEYRATLRERTGRSDIHWQRDLDRDVGVARVPLELLAELQDAARRGGWEG